MAKRIVDSVVFAFLKSLNAIRLYPRDVPWTIKASGFIALAREKERERERERGRERGRERERERIHAFQLFSFLIGYECFPSYCAQESQTYNQIFFFVRL